ncbi:MAG: 30S ribosomal protein S18 [Bacillota bacterium]|nr:30S ribosomal protein S18 [Bacillota bacterium]
MSDEERNGKYDRGGDRGKKGGKFRGRRRKKVCAFCTDKSETIDYKDVNKLRRFLTERGKIMPRRMSGNCAKHQRELSIAIKRARVVALLPYVSES